MIKRRSHHLGLAAFTIAAVTAVSAAWSLPGAASASPTDGHADCQFAIRASNNLGHDVHVYLYDSRVRVKGTGVLTFWKQLKIQNHRIAPGKLMDRRYTTDGNCPRNRQWEIKVKRGSRTGRLLIDTGGTSSDSRTVDLGPASRWDL